MWQWGTTYGATDGPGGPSMAAVLLYYTYIHTYVITHIATYVYKYITISKVHN